MGKKTKFTESLTFIRLLSIFLALILWFFIAGDRQEYLGFEVRTFSGIPLAWRNLGEGLVVVEIEDTVTLSLQGLPRAFEGLTPAHFDAYVDLSGKGEGRHEVRISATAPPGLSVVRIEPAKTDVLLDNIITRQVFIEGEIIGEPGEGMVVDDYSFDPPEVFVLGPRRKLDTLERVVCRVDVEGIGNSISKSIGLYPLDAAGDVVPGVEVVPEEVDVQVSIILPERAIPVEAVFRDNDGRVSSYIVEPRLVTVRGPRQLLDEITALFTEEIDLEGRHSSFTVEVKLVVPEGVTCEHDTVQVRAYIPGAFQSSE